MSRYLRLLPVAFACVITVCGLAMPDAQAVFDNRLAVWLVQGRSIISGVVFDPTGRPVEKARVELLDDNYTILRSFRTTGTGRFEFKGLSPGAFNVRVIHEAGEYAEQMQRIELISFNRGDNTRASADYRQVDFYLKPKNVRGSRASTGVVFSQTVPEGAKKSYSKAVGELDRKKIDEGIAGLKSAIELFPEYYLALARLGEEYAKRGQFEEARNVLARAVKVNSKGQESFFWLGIAEFNLKHLPEAAESFRQAVQLNPSSVNSVMWLGVALRHAGKLDEAEAQLKLARKLSPQPIPQAHWELALLYNKQQRYGEAASELELFLKAQPDSRDADGIKKLIKQLREKGKERAKQ